MKDKTKLEEFRKRITPSMKLATKMAKEFLEDKTKPEEWEEQLRNHFWVKDTKSGKEYPMFWPREIDLILDYIRPLKKQWTDEARREGYIEGQAVQVEQNVIVEMDKQIDKARQEELKRIIEWLRNEFGKYGITENEVISNLISHLKS